jgi:DNA mismatch endonuclease (patch repair protein)
MTQKKTKKKRSTNKTAFVKPSPERSAIMRAVKGKDTKPELLIRAFLLSKRFKFETYANLPGKPDLVLPRRRIIIRVMGCFWHGHSCKRGKRQPKTNSEYWRTKISRNQERDRQNKALLEKIGWQIIDAWECNFKRKDFSICLYQKIISI